MKTEEHIREITACTAKYHCEHVDRRQIQYRTSNGGVQIKYQCLNCGEPWGQPTKQNETTKGLPFFDESIRKKFSQSKQSEFDAIEAKYTELRNRKDDSWWRNYNQHLRTPKWQATRELVLKRQSFICEGCGKQKATEVHHTSYVHVGNEFLFELAAVCEGCHRRLHPNEYSGFDELPCSGCRWQSEDKNRIPLCGKYDVQSIEALSMEGECGPHHEGLEPLK
jgi:5-methylcytosine-specific restriction endonuclease McrA